MSTPSFDPDDPRLTAYALGEGDEHERRAVEDWLTQSAAAQAEVEQTRALARVLAADYAQENERYMASRPGAASPSNVVAFSVARTRRWPRATASILKAAAVLALVGSLVYLGLRRGRPAVTGMVASAPAGAPPAGSPPSPATTPLPGVQTGNKDRVLSAEADAVPSPGDTTAPNGAGPGTSADSLLAMNGEPKPAGAGASASGRAAVEPARPAPVMRRQASAMSAAAAKSAPRPASFAVPGEQAARSTVRVRSPDGRFFGGVIVSPDGLILAAATLPDNTVQQPCTVLLPDRSEVSAVATPSQLGAGWCWLRIKAHGFAAASPAANPPASTATLTVPVVDPASGELTFSHTHTDGVAAATQDSRRHPDPPLQATNDTGFAFDPAGELLVFAQAGAQALSSGRERAAVSRSVATTPAARPFTTAEREILRRTIELGENQ